ncbi:MAG: major capsid protein [Treponema sp.]|jgi:hypothetical protein|nr:major capsid protein [Treponema sp.]
MSVVIITPDDIERVVADNPAAPSNALDYFKRRPLKNSAYIAVRDILQEVGNIPVVRRGDTGIRPVSESGVNLIEPMPIEIDDTFSAVELDEYERSSQAGKQQLVQEKLQQHLTLIRATTKALCVQAHHGKIDYMMKAGAGLVRYQVTYGTGDVEVIDNPIAPEDLTVGDLISAVSGGIKAMAASQVGGPVDIVVSADLFTVIANLVAAQKAFNSTVSPGYVDLAGFRFKLDNDSYVDQASGGTKTTKTLCDPGQLMIRAENAGQSLPYCKIDDVVLREAVPFYSFTKDRVDQRGTDVFSKSKPFPLINVRGIKIVQFDVS